MPTQKKLIMHASPHITDKISTRQIMIEVCIALFPALVLGIVFFGFYVLLIVSLSITTCVLFEFLYNLIRKKPVTIGDFSAVVTGLILGLILPPKVPFYFPIVGGFFAIVLVKMLFGGLGKNFANPAATARIFLLLAWTVAMTSYVLPFTYMEPIRTGATPLHMNNPVSLLDLFLGNHGGSIGETSALALLVGGAYLTIRKIVDWKIPLTLILTFALFVLIFDQDITAVLPAVLSGGLIFGSFFMATDYSTSPNTFWGTLIYSFIIGFFAAFFRCFSRTESGFVEEGLCYAIVLGNLATPLLDKWIIPKPFGYKKPEVLKNEEK